MTDAVNEEVQSIIGEIVDETKEQFREEPDALPEAARGKFRARRTDSITIFLDGVAGEEYSKVQSALDALTGAIAHATELEDTDTAASLQEQYDVVEAKATEYKAALSEDAYTFELRALPPVIMKGLRRETRAEVGIKDKGIPAVLEEAYDELFPLKMILKMTVRFVDHGESSDATELTAEKLREIYDYGDEFQWLRLTNLANDLQFRNTISASVAESPDFLQGI